MLWLTSQVAGRKYRAHVSAREGGCCSKPFLWVHRAWCRAGIWCSGIFLLSQSHRLCLVWHAYFKNIWVVFLCFLLECEPPASSLGFLLKLLNQIPDLCKISFSLHLMQGWATHSCPRWLSERMSNLLIHFPSASCSAAVLVIGLKGIWMSLVEVMCQVQSSVQPLANVAVGQRSKALVKRT